MAAMAHHLIDTADALARLADRLSDVSEIAVDFEGEYNLHRYGIHLCLIQIADQSGIYLVDPVVLGSVAPLRGLFGRPEVTKVMYSADEDVKLIKKGQGFGVAGLFDLQIAARLLGYSERSLDSLVSRHTGVDAEKPAHLQRSDWNLRPLREEQLEYAADDVRYLLPIFRTLTAELRRRGLLDEAAARSRALESREFTPDPRPYLRIKQAGALGPEERIVLKYLFYARDQVARTLDWPAYRVLANGRLLGLADRPPKSWDKIDRLPAAAEPHRALFAFAQRLAEAEMLEAGAGDSPQGRPQSWPQGRRRRR